MLVLAGRGVVRRRHRALRYLWRKWQHSAQWVQHFQLSPAYCAALPWTDTHVGQQSQLISIHWHTLRAAAQPRRTVCTRHRHHKIQTGGLGLGQKGKPAPCSATQCCIGTDASPRLGFRREQGEALVTGCRGCFTQDCFRPESRLCLADAVTAAVLVHTTWRLHDH